MIMSVVGAAIVFIWCSEPMPLLAYINSLLSKNNICADIMDLPIKLTNTVGGKIVKTPLTNYRYNLVRKSV